MWELLMEISDEELLHFNQLGLVPGPDESKEAFIKRVNYCLKLRSNLSEQCGFAEPLDSQLGQQLLKEIAPTTQKLFDISVEWVPVIFSNHKLAPWHGGCAWIFQSTPETPVGAFFQLRQAFANSPTYLGIYNRTELMAHEAAHVGRMMFHEPKFEELLAYRTSSSSLRKRIGPIIESPWESILFVIALVLSISIDFANIFSESPNYFEWIKGLPWMLLALGLGRVWLRHYQFSRCLKKLNELVGKSDSQKANAIIYRLLDKEIIQFGKMPLNQIKEYITEQVSHSLRWMIIKKTYLN